MPAPRRPNILWYCTDQQRYDTIRALGNPHIRTSTLDRLAAGGVAFTHAFAQSPVCTPSRATFLTGRYPASHHVYRNGGARFPAQETLVTRLFADAGYDCGLVGKLHLAAALGDAEPRVDDGYRVFLWSHHPGPGRPRVNAYHDWLRQEKGVDPRDVFSPLPGVYGPGVPADLHQTTWCSEMAIRFVTERRRGPWLLSVNVFDPHPPFDPPAEYLGRYDPATLPLPLFRESDIGRQKAFRAIPQQSLDAVDPADEVASLAAYPDTEAWLGRTHRPPPSFDGRRIKAAYYAMIELVDDQLARILAALEATGQVDDTLVLFTSDHGELLGDHGLLYKGCRFFEGLVRVPLIWAWPAAFATGIVSDALVELVDLAPTLLDAAGLAVPGAMQGRSLLPILEGRGDPHVHKPHVVSEYHDSMGSTPITTPVHASMYRDRQHKLVVYHGHELGELYDLEADPGEFDNLWSDAGARALKADLLKRHFDAMMATISPGAERVAMG